MRQDIFKHYTLGIPKLDEEHKNLIDLMETIMKCVECHDKNVCDVTIQKLQECFEQHLNDEENLMEEIEYPYFEWHKSLHNGIRHRLNLIISNMRLHGYSLDKYATESLRDIFIKHIDEQDMQIVQFINKNRM